MTLNLFEKATALEPMKYELLVEQTKLESRALEHITQALEVMISWDVGGVGFGRKLANVRFFTELYQRHLERVFALEEVDGYMESVSRTNPELAMQVDQLKTEHEMIRRAVRKALVRLDLASPSNVSEFETTCNDLRSTINGVLEHLRREEELLVESFQRDSGGEG